VQVVAGNDVLAAARFAFDQNRIGEVGVLAQLQAQALHGQAFANQAARCVAAGRGVETQDLPEKFGQSGRIAGFGDEFDGAQGARVAGIFVVALAGEHDDLEVRVEGEQVADQCETFVGAMRQGGRPRSTRARRRVAQLSDQAAGMRAGVAGQDVVFLRKGETERFADQ
jgi:hypothetical protein